MSTAKGGAVNPWVVAVVVSVATFMEVLDTTIANVALRSIAGSEAAGMVETTSPTASITVALVCRWLTRSRWR